LSSVDRNASNVKGDPGDPAVALSRVGLEQLPSSGRASHGIRHVGAATLALQSAAERARPITWIAAAAIFAIAAGVRLLGVGRFGFNSDEAVYAGQAAALAGHQEYAAMFGVFRAHPLLVHLVVSLVYRLTGVNDLAPRLVCVAAGLALVLTAGATAAIVRGRRVGLITMLIVALSPYPVIVSRQMLLDGPMAFFFALCVLFLALYVRNPSRPALFAAACAAGLAFLAKETAILMVPAIVVFFLLARGLSLPVLDAVGAVVVYAVTIAPFPLSLLLSGGSKLAQQFFIWQVFRRPNHDPGFYLTLIPTIGIPVVALTVVGVILALRRRQPLDILLLSLTVVMAAFFQAWPVKGFQYLLPIAVPIAILAADGVIGTAALVAGGVRRLSSISWLPPVRAPAASMTTGLALVLVCAVVMAAGLRSVIASQAPAILATDSGQEDAGLTPGRDVPAYTFVAGTGGLEASRPVGAWVKEHTLPSSNFLTVGPSFANVIQFYGGRRARALSVSPNPLHRNPTYEPVLNPDLMIRTNAIQYLVYDSYSAARTPFFTQRLLNYVKKYNGILIYSDYQPARRPDGKTVRVPVVLIYGVHP
jgi:Dolichyl-phosphate-mannose-protein mannosyltransferase